MVEGNKRTAKSQREQGTYGPEWVELRKLCVYELRKHGVSYAKIGRLLSLSRSYVQLIERRRTMTKKEETPRKVRGTNLRLDPDVWDRIEKIAIANRRTPTNQMEYWVLQSLEREGKKRG